MEDGSATFNSVEKFQATKERHSKCIFKGKAQNEKQHIDKEYEMTW